MRARFAVLRPMTARPGSLRRMLLTLVLGLVAFSVVGMHQLSLSHAFAVPDGADRPAATAQLSGGVGGEDSQHDAMASGTGQPGGHQADAAVTATSGSAGSAGGDRGCPGCGGHSMAFTACLLALTLLVLFWWLAPPRLRHLPPSRVSWPLCLTLVVARRVPALSLAELSVLRA